MIKVILAVENLPEISNMFLTQSNPNEVGIDGYRDFTSAVKSNESLGKVCDVILCRISDDDWQIVGMYDNIGVKMLLM